MKKLAIKLISLKKSYKIAISIVLIVALWMGIGSAFNPEETIDTRTIAQKEAQSQKHMQTVRIKKVTAETIMRSVSISGRTLSSRTVNLKSEISGRVESIDFTKGTQAKEGTTLVSLAIDDRSSLLDKAKANLQEKEISYNAKLKLKEKGLSSISALSAAESDLEQAKAEVETAELNLENTKIKAPFDGVFEDKYIDVGDFVSIGQNVVKFVDLNPIKAVGYISENIRSDVSIGTRAIVTFQDGREVEGTVSYISSSANEATRTYKFEVEIPNDNNHITEGLTCTIKLDVASMVAHKISPSLIVLDDEGKIGLRSVDENNIVRFLEVDFLTDESENLWLSGLPDEFNIITVGQEFVEDGQEVIATYEEQE